jgi:signal transduction histidine kinase
MASDNNWTDLAEPTSEESSSSGSMNWRQLFRGGILELGPPKISNQTVNVEKAVAERTRELLHGDGDNKFWRSLTQCSVASLTPVLLTLVVYRLHLNLATASVLYMIVVVLLSRAGSFISSIVASIVAALCLAHLAPPAFSFRVEDKFDDVAIIAFLIVSSIIAHLMSRVRKQADEALSSVSYRVIETEEQERQRIAKDFHEGIVQRLILLVIEIDQLKAQLPNKFDVPGRVDAALRHTSEILSDVKTLAHELYSPRLEYLGIAAVMRNFCRELSEQKEVEIDFRGNGLPSSVMPDTSLCLFRVLQEALHNAVQHSGVRQFGVQLNGTSKEIHLTVRDCGVGFNLETAKTSRGLGLNHMQERLKLVKGTLSIDSQPTRGTTIHARVPLNSAIDPTGVAA